MELFSGGGVAEWHPAESPVMATRARRASHSPSLTARAGRAAVSPAAKAAYVAIGAIGLAALAIAIFGPRRFQQEVVRPVRTAVSDQAERLWSEAQPLRAQLGGLIERATSESGREKLIRNFQSWIGHFKAT
jgi:NAD/NADP transhydrogenase alpha subunit